MFWDIGANNGVDSVLALRAGATRVVAVEPQPRMALELRRTFARLDRTRNHTRVVEAAFTTHAPSDSFVDFLMSSYSVFSRSDGPGAKSSKACNTPRNVTCTSTQVRAISPARLLSEEGCPQVLKVDTNVNALPPLRALFAQQCTPALVAIEISVDSQMPLMHLLAREQDYRAFKLVPQAPLQARWPRSSGPLGDFALGYVDCAGSGTLGAQWVSAAQASSFLGARESVCASGWRDLHARL